MKLDKQKLVVWILIILFILTALIAPFRLVLASNDFGFDSFEEGVQGEFNSELEEEAEPYDEFSEELYDNSEYLDKDFYDDSEFSEESYNDSEYLEEESYKESEYESKPLLESILGKMNKFKWIIIGVAITILLILGLILFLIKINKSASDKSKSAKRTISNTPKKKSQVTLRQPTSLSGDEIEEVKKPSKRKPPKSNISKYEDTQQDEIPSAQIAKQRLKSCIRKPPR